ncbi:hypothetical protein PIB30_022524 [Stylosanthes scabra]|uniref:Uncharacterized protein n=1 Tax=Stylosanthes scabra TaxID=79078 RepID=A0ABU6V9G6_9FABA|nr:hypothetical protein [Stylosanthes scabra]
MRLNLTLLDVLCGNFEFSEMYNITCHLLKLTAVIKLETLLLMMQAVLLCRKETLERIKVKRLRSLLRKKETNDRMIRVQHSVIS